MTCNEARRHWNLYHDSEGDAELHFQINEHLAVCPECAEWFAQQSRFENLLVDRLRSGSATPALWNKVLTNCGLRRQAPSRRWVLLSGVVACAAALALGALWHGRLSRTATAADLAWLGAARHERLAQGQETVQFASQSDLEVDKYLRQQVSFPVRCPPRQDAGFAVQGAGACRLGDQPAAYLLGKVDQSPVSIFVLPRDGLEAFPHQAAALRREKTHHCREGQYAMVLGVIDKNAVLVIGQADPDRLEKVLKAYGTYAEH